MDALLFPNDDNTVNLSVIPAGRNNNECVYDYPDNLGDESYVYTENNTQEDLYDLSTLPADLALKINSITVHAVCKAENAVNDCHVYLSIRPAAATSYSVVADLTTSYQTYEYTWSVNPETDDFWSMADLANLVAGIKLVSDGAGTEARCTQVYLTVNISVLGYYISNSSLFSSDSIPLNADFGVLLSIPRLTGIPKTVTPQIRYQDPDGNTGLIEACIIDNMYVFGSVPDSDNDMTGKWRFKPYLTLPSGEIMEGDEKFVNVKDTFF